jgi:hypothetical protein
LPPFSIKIFRLRAYFTPCRCAYALPPRRHAAAIFRCAYAIIDARHADISPLFEAPCHYVLPPPTPLLLLIIIERYCLFTLLIMPLRQLSALMLTPLILLALFATPPCRLRPPCRHDADAISLSPCHCRFAAAAAADDAIDALSLLMPLRQLRATPLIADFRHAIAAAD